MIATRTAALVLIVAAGCAPTREPVCFPLTIDCSGTIPPTFGDLRRDVLAPSCGTGLSCHVEDDRPAGDLRLDDEVLAYDTLLDPARGLVVPGRPECSEVVWRVISTGVFVRMPPATPLEPAEVCLIVAWISAGAAR